MIKIPPPLIVLVLIVSIYFSSKKIDLINIPLQLEISIFILSAGILIFVNPVLQFIKSKTTVNPIKTLTPRFITRTLEKIKKTEIKVENTP